MNWSVAQKYTSTVITHIQKNGLTLSEMGCCAEFRWTPTAHRTRCDSMVLFESRIPKTSLTLSATSRQRNNARLVILNLKDFFAETTISNSCHCSDRRLRYFRLEPIA